MARAWLGLAWSPIANLRRVDSWNVGSAPAASLACWATGGHPTVVAWPTRSPTRSGCWSCDGRLRAADPGPGRARAGGRAAGQPDHGGRRLRGAARRAGAAQPSRRGQLDAAAAGADRRRPGLAVLPPGQRPRRHGRTVRPGPRRACRPRPPSCAGRRRPPSLDLDAHLGGHGYELLGLPALRAAIADRFTARGLPTGPDQILVTTGALHAIALALTALAGPGERVLVEHPTYPNVLHALSNLGRPAGAGVHGTGAGRLLGPGADHGRGARRRAAAGLPDPGLPEPDRRPARRGRAGSAGRAGPPHRDHAARRRVAGRADPGRTATAPGGRARGRRLAAGAHRRLGQQDGLGRVAGRLDPDLGGHGAPARPRPGRRWTSAGRCWTSWWSPGCWPTSSRCWPPAGSSCAAARDHLLGRLAQALPRLAAVPAGGWAEPVGRPGRGRCPAGSPRPPGGATCCWPPGRGSAWTAHSSGTCGCRTRCAGTGWTRPWTGWRWPGGTAPSGEHDDRADRGGLTARRGEPC